MEGIVAKRTLKKSYYNKNIINTKNKDITFSNVKKRKSKAKTNLLKYKEKILFKLSIQSITMISIIVFILGMKYFNINVVLESDVTQNIIKCYNKSYSINEILKDIKFLSKKSYSFVKPIIPNIIEEKTIKTYKIIIDKIANKEYGNNKKDDLNNGEVMIYEETSIVNKENTIKENVGVSADIDEEKEITVSSSISSETNILEKIKNTKLLFVKPTEGIITSHFGAREVIFEGIDSYHYGTDIAASIGTNIVSSIEGIVTRADYNKYNGNFVEVKNGEIATIYCHMSTLTVKVGDNVKAGSKIGEMGSTGLSTGPHLHFEIVFNGTKIDPELVLNL